jgi:putative ABC transport system substrate-binding protein
MRRREFITLMGGATAWPLAARAQQRGMPVIAYLSGRSAESDRSMLAAFEGGLKELGYEQGRNLTIEYRFADGQYDRVPALVTETIRRRVAVIVCVGTAAPQSVWDELRASRIPVVVTGSNPVEMGLAASFNRPGGTFTGVYTLVAALTGKILQLTHDLVPGVTTIGLIVDKHALIINNIGLDDFETVRDAREAVANLGLQVIPRSVLSAAEIENAFAMLNERGVGAICVVTSPFFVAQAKLFADLAARYRLPAVYPRREFAEAGGLMSYGYNVAESYRVLGNHTGRILNGTSPADLPVFLPSTYEFVINLRTARALGLEVPPALLALSTEVIE